MRISAGQVNKILKQYKYSLVMDKLHNINELKKYQKFEKNFNDNKYLTIKDGKGIVIGRIYNINSFKDLSLDRIDLSETEITLLLAFFKFFRMPGMKQAMEKVLKLVPININEVHVDIIRNNVYKQEINDK